MVLKFVKVLSQVKYHKEKLEELEKEIAIQAEFMRIRGLTWDMVAPKVGVVLLTMAPETREMQHPSPLVGSRRCKQWNRGFCRDKAGCLFSHPPGDCKDHLDGRYTTRGCKVRHRKKFKYWTQVEGCYRGNKCEYLHGKENIENKIEHKDKEV